jgi:6,7-dimethyl-8-ribityllumazine synthase
MATSLNSGPEVLVDLHENVGKKKIGIVTASWNKDITSVLEKGAKDALFKAGLTEENILAHSVPGAFELPLGAQYLIEFAHCDAVVCIGCLIKGETPHFHYISEAVSIAISQLQMRYNRPVSFGLLTVDTLEQAEDRAGGKYGNKGEEAAQAALQMLSMKEYLKKGPSSKPSIGFGS